MKQFKEYLFPIAAALLVTLLVGLGVLRRLDRWAQDWLFQRPGIPSGDIVVIGIDEEALELLGPYNTWDRNIVASALEALAADPEKSPPSLPSTFSMQAAARSRQMTGSRQRPKIWAM